MSATLLEPGTLSRSVDEDCLICADCFPGYEPERVVRSLCGRLVADQPECEVEACCEQGCGVACRLCLIAVASGGCVIHPN